ncbi:MAG: helix-turn-helix domain-containing protein [Oscillospiraceae bacterium]|nr:helix-turn-helix domain-containing protein [Oscillospiraceae bacterium]
MLGKRIKQMRTAAGFSQTALAQKLNISQSTLSGYETGYSMPNYDTVEKIAEICEFDIMFIDKNSEEII